MLELNPDSCFVAVEQKRVMGTIFGTFNGRRGWLYHLAVHPRFQKRGVGTLLLKNAENVLKKVGVKKIYMFAERSNPKLLNFYEKRGYGNGDDMVHLRKVLV